MGTTKITEEEIAAGKAWRKVCKRPGCNTVFTTRNEKQQFCCRKCALMTNIKQRMAKKAETIRKRIELRDGNVPGPIIVCSSDNTPGPVTFEIESKNGEITAEAVVAGMKKAGIESMIPPEGSLKITILGDDEEED